MTATAADGAYTAQENKEQVKLLLKAKRLGKAAYDRSKSGMHAARAWVNETLATSQVIDRVRDLFSREGVRALVERVGAGLKAVALGATALINKVVHNKKIRKAITVVLTKRVVGVGYLVTQAWRTNWLFKIANNTWDFIGKGARVIAGWMVRAEDKLVVDDASTRADKIRNKVANFFADVREGCAKVDEPVTLWLFDYLSPAQRPGAIQNKKRARKVRFVQFIMRSLTIFFEAVIFVMVLMQDVLLGVAFIFATFALREIRRWWVGEIGQQFRGRVAKSGGTMRNVVATPVRVVKAKVAALRDSRRKDKTEDEATKAEEPKEAPKPKAEEPMEDPKPKAEDAGSKPKGKPTPKQPNQGKRYRENAEALNDATNEAVEEMEEPKPMNRQQRRAAARKKGDPNRTRV